MAPTFLCPSEPGMALFISTREECLVSTLVRASKADVTSVSVSAREEGIASGPVSPDKASVSLVSISTRKEGIACLFISPSKGDSFLFLSIPIMRVWPCTVK